MITTPIWSITQLELFALSIYISLGPHLTNNEILNGIDPFETHLSIIINTGLDNSSFSVVNSHTLFEADDKYFFSSYDIRIGNSCSWKG